MERKDENKRDLEKLNNWMKRLKEWANTVMSAGCYGDKNQKEMLQKAEVLGGDITDPEIRMLDEIFKARKKGAKTMEGLLKEDVIDFNRFVDHIVSKKLKRKNDKRRKENK